MTTNGNTMVQNSLEECMACGSDDLCDIFASAAVECSACEARHYPDGDKWICASGDGVRGIQATEADVKYAFEDTAFDVMRDV